MMHFRNVVRRTSAVIGQSTLMAELYLHFELVLSRSQGRTNYVLSPQNMAILIPKCFKIKLIGGVGTFKVDTGDQSL